MPIAGYVDRFSRRPGELIRLHVSVRETRPYRARLVRVLSADANPRGPGIRYQDLARHFDQTRQGQRHPIHLGSYADCPAPLLAEAGSYTWTALVRPGLLSATAQVIMSHESEDRRFTLSFVAGCLLAEVTRAGEEMLCSLECTLQKNRWYRVWASCDSLSGRLIIGLQAALTRSARPIVREINAPNPRLPSEGRLLVAAKNLRLPQAHFDGRIEDPAIVTGCFDSWDDPLMRLDELGLALRAGWNFSIGISAQSIFDVGPDKLHGTLINVPTRAVRGARWNGEEMCWKHRPQDYAAIHFHSDDLGDCEWPAECEFRIPKDLGSGSYAFHLSCVDGEDWVPFYIVPALAGPHARIAFLAPTFTYQAYANHARGNYDEALRSRVRSWGAFPFDPEDFSIYGVSTYDAHPDGSGVAFSSRLRPILSMRPGFMSINDPSGSGVRHYPADAHLLAWLESNGFAFDVVTDEDLHEEGLALLTPYAAVLTGTHPEYQTSKTLDALRDYIQSGGHLAYLGGNGFYWRIGRNDELPGIIELRRAEGGTRVWAAEPGEYYHATDGAYGGLWCRNGRDPQALVGIGFSAQGPFEATWYRRTPESRDPRFSWIFEGIAGDIIGDYGLNAGAAAGYELDRADSTLGTPQNAVVLARTESVPASFYPCMEAMLLPSMTASGEPSKNLLRADMLYAEIPGGGAVFAVGSITFCGSLWRNGFEGPVSRLLENILRKFAGFDR